ncbi:MAG: membrane protein insertion efficiency factor YidD [Legionellaceae bacterium]|nr:membrane protein insertion efficiency factor YidD [Legionellaceae bacterium]
MGRIIHAARTLIICLIKGYQYLVSPYLGTCCRFYPSCSNYAIQAVHQQGAFKGIWLSIKRVVRCHPWSSGGYDPVLPKYSEINIKLKDKI